jgi:hypothetical protein
MPNSATVQYGATLQLPERLKHHRLLRVLVGGRPQLPREVTCHPVAHRRYQDAGRWRPDCNSLMPQFLPELHISAHMNKVG